MNRLVSRALAIALIAAQTLTIFGQSVAPDAQEERVVVTSSEVVLDAVVKDKKGRPVRDLAAADFAVFEDGVRQQIKSVRLVTRPGASPAAASGEKPASGEAPAPTAPPRGTPPSDVGARAVALVFDRLSPEARTLAREAALSYAGEDGAENSFVGVFGIDLSLRVLQPYTTNTGLVRAAINNASTTSSSTHASTAEQVQSLATRQQSVSANASALEAAATGGGPGNNTSGAGSSAGSARAEQIFLEMTQRSLEVFEMLQRDQQGFATTNALLAVVNSMRSLPGRKAVIFFSEGLSLPPAVQGYFRAVINSANRAGVSIYAVDAAGLRVRSGNETARNEISRLANKGLNRSDRDLVGRPLTMELERNEDLLRANPENGLGELASETGGFLVKETNDLKGKLREVDEDLNTYYLLSYTPQNQNYDGRFRQISVKVERSGAEVQARQGYYAINASFASPILPYEAPALAALSSSGRPDAFPFRLGAFSFPEAARPGLASFLVEAPSSAVTFAGDKDKKTYRTDFSVVVLIRDEAKQVVKKLSNQYVLTGPLDRLEAGKRGEVLFYREAELAPGRYTVEAAIHDALAGKTSVRTAVLNVPVADDGKVRLSDVVLIKRAEKAAPGGPNAAPNPFTFGELLAYPNLNEPVSKSKNKQLALMLTTYIPKGATQAPKMTLNILQAGRSVGQTSTDLSAPDADGRVQYASAIPLDKFQPGVYDLKVEVTDGRTSAARQTRVVVEP